MKFLNIILAGFLALTLLSCQTAQKFDSKKANGQWEAKAQIKDLKNNKKHQVSLDMIGAWPNSLRIEVAGPLGISLASLVLKEHQVAYMLPQEKKYFYGKLTEGAMAPLFQIEFNPRYLLNICFDQPIEERGWTCSKTPEGLPLECVRNADKLTISWKDREGEQKRVWISRVDFEIQIAFKNYKPLVQIPDGVFTLNPPEDFNRYKLQ